MNSTVKLLLEKLIHKAFPEFSNKVTWLLITAGIAILILPVPTYVIFLNLIIDFYNNTVNAHVKLIDIGDFTTSTGAALTLIISGLLYHLAIKSTQLYGEIYKTKTEEIQKERIEIKEKDILERMKNADVKLFETFISLLPTNSASVELLKSHDFGASYHNNSIKDIESFTFKWGKADQHFHDVDLEKKSEHFFNEANNFLDFLALASGPTIRESMFSIPNDSERANDWEWSKKTDDNVQKANEWSHNLYIQYCELVTLCKKNLLI